MSCNKGCLSCTLHIAHCTRPDNGEPAEQKSGNQEPQQTFTGNLSAYYINFQLIMMMNIMSMMMIMVIILMLIGDDNDQKPDNY